MSDRSPENDEEQAAVPDTPRSPEDEYTLPPRAAEDPPRGLPPWVEEKLSRVEEGKLLRRRVKKSALPPFQFNLRDLILLTTGLAGFLGLACMVFRKSRWSLGIAFIGIVSFSILVFVAWVQFQRRRKAAKNALPEATAEEYSPLDVFEETEPPAPPFQFTVADLLLATTAIACFLGLISLIPGEKKLAFCAFFTGIGVFLGLVYISVVDEVHRLIRLAWIMFFFLYIFTSLVAIFSG